MGQKQKGCKMKDYYEILEVKNDTSDEVIKAAYKALIKKYHPDNGDRNDPSGEKMRLVNEAYDILSDPERRKKYDEQYQAEHRRSQENENRYSNVEQEPDIRYREEKKAKKTLFSEIITGVVNGVQNSMDDRKAQIENAYFEANSMPDYTLIENYKNSIGARRIGYGREMEKRGFLIRDSNGNLRINRKYI